MIMCSTLILMKHYFSSLCTNVEILEWLKLSLKVAQILGLFTIKVAQESLPALHRNWQAGEIAISFECTPAQQQ